MRSFILLASLLATTITASPTLQAKTIPETRKVCQEQCGSQPLECGKGLVREITYQRISPRQFIDNEQETEKIGECWQCCKTQHKVCQLMCGFQPLKCGGGLVSLIFRCNGMIELDADVLEKETEKQGDCWVCCGYY